MGAGEDRAGDVSALARAAMQLHAAAALPNLHTFASRQSLLVTTLCVPKRTATLTASSHVLVPQVAHKAMLHRHFAGEAVAHSAPPTVLRRSRPHCSTTCRASVSAERQPRRENVGLERGDAVFVDHTCIDCDTCRCGGLARECAARLELCCDSAYLCMHLPRQRSHDWVFLYRNWPGVLRMIPRWLAGGWTHKHTTV